MLTADYNKFVRDSPPSQCDLRATLRILPPNLTEHRLIYQLAHLLAFGISWVLISKWAVLGNMNVVELMVIRE